MKVAITQYIQPYGTKQFLTVELPDDVCKMARDQVLSCECAPFNSGQVILYSYLKTKDPEEDPEAEHIMFAHNGFGEDSPPVVLERLIRKVNATK